MDNYFMKTLDAFKEFMTGSKAPNYVKRYYEYLNEFKWQWFYSQMKEPIEFVADVDYLFYILKWILKSNFEDLGYEVYFQLVMNPEMRPEPLIKVTCLYSKKIRIKNPFISCQTRIEIQPSELVAS